MLKHRILLYHRVVSDDTHPFILAALAGEVVTQSAFSKQMHWLKRRFVIVSVGECLRRLPAADKPMAVITFDDGFADNHRFALPVLQAHKLQATIFVATDFIDTQSSFIHHQFARALAARPSLRAALPRMQARKLLRHATSEQLLDEKDMKLDEHDRFLSSREIRGFPKEISIQSHGKTHTPLVDLSPDACREELVASKAKLENLLDNPVEYFAYPIGRAEHFDPSSVDQVANAGYTAAFTAVAGEIQADHCPHTLPRFGTRQTLRKTRARLQLSWFS